MFPACLDSETFLGAVADGHADVHQAAVPQHAQDPVVERRSTRQVGAVDAQVIDHAAIVAGPTDTNADEG